MFGMRVLALLRTHIEQSPIAASSAGVGVLRGNVEQVEQNETLPLAVR
jgi:hypothetical protein